MELDEDSINVTEAGLGRWPAGVGQNVRWAQRHVVAFRAVGCVLGSFRRTCFGGRRRALSLTEGGVMDPMETGRGPLPPGLGRWPNAPWARRHVVAFRGVGCVLGSFRRTC